MGGGEIVALIVFMVLVLGVFFFKQSRLNDPSNSNFIYIDQMASNHQLQSGPAAAVLFRQSGNEYRNLGIFDSSDAALREVVKSFRKAHIDSVSVLKNEPSKYEVVRLHHGHGGKAEGKKLGGAVIVSVATSMSLAIRQPIPTLLAVASGPLPVDPTIHINSSASRTSGGGKLGYYGLTDWWLEAFDKAERQTILETFKPFGQNNGTPNPLSEGPTSEIYETSVSFLSTMAGWFTLEKTRHIRFKIVDKAEMLLALEKSALTRHLFFHQKVETFYRWRDTDSFALAKAIDGCLQQIGMAGEAATAFRDIYRDVPLPSHPGFKQLAIIEEKRGNLSAAINLSRQAELQGWAGDWSKRTERLANRLSKHANDI